MQYLKLLLLLLLLRHLTLRTLHPFPAWPSDGLWRGLKAKGLKATWLPSAPSPRLYTRLRERPSKALWHGFVFGHKAQGFLPGGRFAHTLLLSLQIVSSDSLSPAALPSTLSQMCPWGSAAPWPGRAAVWCQERGSSLAWQPRGLHPPETRPPPARPGGGSGRSWEGVGKARPSLPRWHGSGTWQPGKELASLFSGQAAERSGARAD